MEITELSRLNKILSTKREGIRNTYSFFCEIICNNREKTFIFISFLLK